ncbi:MAG: hypothetical protein [Caudoviricetes sp.]|nr:MAG: hypothetical protein [Caudoviricetes sp.]
MELKGLKEAFNDNQATASKLMEEYRASEDAKVGEQLRDLQKVMEGQKEEIRSLEKEQKEAMKVGEVKKEGKRNMEKAEFKELATRAMDSILRKHADNLVDDKNMKEYRDASASLNITEGNAVDNTPANGGATVPTIISDQIVQYLTEDSPVFAQARKLNVGAGYVDVLRETTIAQAGFVGELTSVPQTANKFAKVHLKATRVGAFIQLTQNLINDSEFDIVTYSTQYLTRGLAKALERAILVGENSDDTFESVEAQADANHTATISIENLQYEDLIKLYGSLNPAYLDGAIFVVSRPMFKAIMSLADRKNQTGDYLIGKNLVEGEPGYRLFGTVPVYVSDQLNNTNTNIVFGNFEAGYTVMVKKGMNITHVVNDSAQALQGGHLIVLDAYMDGAVTNPEAFVIGQEKANAGATPQATIQANVASSASGSETNTGK